MIPVPAHKRLRSMTELAGPAVSPAPPKRGEPLVDLSARKIGHVWTTADHEHLMREIDASECVRREGKA